MTETILTPIYEAEFLGFSYGFRRGRGAHDALDALAVGYTRGRTNDSPSAPGRAQPKGGAGCLNGHVRICAGGAG